MRTEKGITIMVLEEKEIEILKDAKEVFSEILKKMDKEESIELANETDDCTVTTYKDIGTCIDTCAELIESYRMRML